MAWIELHQTLWTHRKTLVMSAALSLPAIYTAAHMAHFWCWALDNAPDGDLSGLPKPVIAAGAAWTGDPDAFVEAAVTAGFFDRDGDSLRLHDWDDYAGRLIDRRAAERERSRQRRAAMKQPKGDQQTTDGRPLDGQQTTVGTVPNRTVPNSTVPSTRTPPPPSPTPDGVGEGTGVKDKPNNPTLSGLDEVLQGHSRYTPEQQAMIRDYWDIIRFTRKTARISPRIIANEMDYWARFPPDIVMEALSIHVRKCQGKEENYTRGIMRRIAKERRLLGEQDSGDRGTSSSRGAETARRPTASDYTSGRYGRFFESAEDDEAGTGS